MKIAIAFLLVGLAAPHAAAQTPPPATQPPPAPIGTTGSDTSTSTPAAPKPMRGAEVGNDYRLAFGDKLRIEVYREPQLSQSVEVRPDGKITLPLTGDISAAGSTPRELGDAITEQLREYVTNPVVTVIVAEAMPPVVYIMGEVNSPGMQPVRAPITVLQALAVAGGFKEFANTKKIRILRPGPNGTVKTIPFNYRDALDRPDRPLFLEPGDTVVVP
jgi:polysaccharide biosynthesis/export protein